MQHESTPRTREEIAAAIERGEAREIEVAWSDQQGHLRGKRVPGRLFLGRADGAGIAFCDAALTWDMSGDILEGMRLTGWDTGYPDLFAKPQLETFHWLPWRPGAALVMSDLFHHDGSPVRTGPRTVLRNVVDRLASHGYRAEVGVEIEFYLLREDGTPFFDDVQCYSLPLANAIDPILSDLMSTLEGFVDVEAGNVEYGPAQCEVNLHHAHPLEAADQATRFKYGARELARRAGAITTFMAKPFNVVSGSSMHLHVSLWRDDEPAFAPDGHDENPLMRSAIGGIMKHLPSIVLYGSPTVNSYKRYEPLSFAPTTATWGGDNRTCSVRSLIESPSATRIELRTGAADAQPYWSIAGVLAAVVAGVEGKLDPGPKGTGNMYGQGELLPATLADAVAAARADATIVDILGEDAVHDYAGIAMAEWQRFCLEVTDWDRKRYMKLV